MRDRHLAFVGDSRFRVDALLGEGGCARVFQALDRRTGETVALKVLTRRARRDAVMVARFAREARAALAINHPNVCRVSSCGQLDDGQPYVAMERLLGETLRHYMRRRGQLSAEEAIEIGVQILSGLEATHERGLVHRDVKPENVFLSWRPEGSGAVIKLLDFGLCRSVDAAIGDTTLTEQGSVVGTPGYLAPEYVRGNRADTGTDLFAVGLILFEALAGRAVYGGDGRLQRVAALLTHRVPPLRVYRVDLPIALDRIIRHATQHDPRARYTSAARFLHDLLEARTAIRRALLVAEGRVALRTRPMTSREDLSPADDDSSNLPTRRFRICAA